MHAMHLTLENVVALLAWLRRSRQPRPGLMETHREPSPKCSCARKVSWYRISRYHRSAAMASSTGGCRNDPDSRVVAPRAAERSTLVLRYLRVLLFKISSHRAGQALERMSYRIRRTAEQWGEFHAGTEVNKGNGENWRRTTFDAPCFWRCRRLELFRVGLSLCGFL